MSQLVLPQEEYPTDRGKVLKQFRESVREKIKDFPTYWKCGPVRHTLYAAVIKGLIKGNLPQPPPEG